ncbi:hypothetical protein [Noviherbaspirillum saxi]|uniref:Uncharacterized protein n=1 Tax=Noviherbaspirillum saxi TaxID=2320863 RepID=A0A3A3G4V8_9BURK|nr:hypothetical protein [Noviherbaspirillum saxi]RJF97165.1 hypothetical protein D3871_00415 [Noviherbaspirillum saxi]
MRFSFITIASAVLALGFSPAHANDVNVGVSVGGQISPGVYGRINIGNTPPPLVYQQPVVIARQARPVAPVYMHVPPGHAKNWGKHCHRYSACGQPVYFVKSSEYGGGGRGHKDRHHGHGKHDKHDKHDGHKEKKNKHHDHHD